MKAPTVLIAIAGTGLVYWAVFKQGGLLTSSPDREQLLANATAGIGSGSAGGVPTTANGTATVNQFKDAISHFESGGNYMLVNGHGSAPDAASLYARAKQYHVAFGKYQFLPGEWDRLTTQWYGHVILPTPENQEAVATRRFTQLFSSLHDWRLVAVAWRSGYSITSKPISSWTAGTVRYVNNIGCYLSSHYGTGYPLISLIGHMQRSGIAYSDTMKPYGNLTIGSCMPSSGWQSGYGGGAA